jgi:hypothetical protein
MDRSVWDRIEDVLDRYDSDFEVKVASGSAWAGAGRVAAGFVTARRILRRGPVRSGLFAR